MPHIQSEGLAPPGLPHSLSRSLLRQARSHRSLAFDRVTQELSLVE
jgi:hypothetical protein